MYLSCGKRGYPWRGKQTYRNSPGFHCPESRNGKDDREVKADFIKDDDDDFFLMITHSEGLKIGTSPLSKANALPAYSQVSVTSGLSVARGCPHKEGATQSSSLCTPVSCSGLCHFSTCHTLSLHPFWPRTLLQEVFSD